MGRADAKHTHMHEFMSDYPLVCVQQTDPCTIASFVCSFFQIFEMWVDKEPWTDHNCPGSDYEAVSTSIPALGNASRDLQSLAPGTSVTAPLQESQFFMRCIVFTDSSYLFIPQRGLRSGWPLYLHVKVAFYSVFPIFEGFCAPFLG